ncbi:MAG: hypothetical protein WCF81_18450 [Roseiarcus sp.]
MPESEEPGVPDVADLPALVTFVRAWQAHIKDNWEAFIKPPILATVIIIAGLAYYFGVSRSSELNGVKDERITFLNDQLTAYKDRLQGASPDEAAKQVSELRSQLGRANEKLQMILPDKPRRLEDKEKDALLRNIDKLKSDIKVLFVYAWLNGDSTEYASDFTKLLSANNIPNIGPIATTCNTAERGILVGLPDPQKPSDSAVEFTKILQEAGLHVGQTLWSSPPSVIVPSPPLIPTTASTTPALAAPVLAPTPPSGAVAQPRPIVPDFDLFICGGGD